MSVNKPLRECIFKQLPKGSLLLGVLTNEWTDRKGRNRGIIFQVDYQEPGDPTVHRTELSAAVVLGYLFAEAVGANVD